MTDVGAPDRSDHPNSGIPSPAGAPRRKGGRLLFIDLSRSVTVLMMVQGHILHALLHPAWTRNAIFEAWHLVRGLTAPMFLTMAGMSFTVATLKRWDQHHELGPQVRSRLQRFAFFMLLGYVIHIPVRPIRRLAGLDHAGWAAFLQVDVLQLIALSLTVLQLLVYLAKRPARYGRICAVLAIGVVAATPVVRAIDWQHYLWSPIAAFVYSGTGSIFPIFGWAAFPLVGAALGIAIGQQQPFSMARTLRWFLQLGLAALVLAAVLGQWIDPALYGQAIPESKPSFLLNRLGGVMLLLTGFSLISTRVQRLPAPMQALAEESLVVYVLHLCIVYGSVWNHGLQQRFAGAMLGLGGTLTVIALMLPAMVIAAYHWNRFKKGYPHGKKLARASLAVVLSLLLL